MPTNVKDLLAAANAEVPRISPDEARKMVAEQNAVIVDVRDKPELQTSGKIPGSVHIPRGMLEFRADAETPYHDANLSKDRPIILHCASGGRSALSGQTLRNMGYQNVYNLGGFKDWVEAGGDVEKVD
ncbi:rhodanese-like domain-containing protein [Devosia naphthalenivorans]|jgi:rhodanese-related sulfurtransferase|uniref:rhodanese-like domain-containing protein n=1 Tax=Devosia naphthalenivorans TaxID=2082392 RepID=UPI000D3B6233|nr:rhodanese-like domain-containing protein [Devosia naphthalenivorans]